MNSVRLASNRSRRAGFTLMEIMIVVVIIGLLAAMAIPAMQKVRRNAQHKRFVSDLRVFVQSFEQYAVENGSWPPNVGSGAVPANMTTALHIQVWTTENTLGGRWNWDRNFHYAAAVTTTNAIVSDSEMKSIDASIDDGDLTTGIFRKASNRRFSYILEE